MPKFRSSFGGMTSASKIKIQRVMYILGCPPFPVTVTTRIVTFLVGDPELNLHLPQLLGGGTIQVIYYIYTKKPVVGTIEVYN